MQNKTTIIVAALFIFLLGAAPVTRAQMGPGTPGMQGDCPMCPMGQMGPGKHMHHHDEMGNLMGMLKETMGIVKDMEHVPGSATTRGWEAS
jgi:hypothetical protein